MLITLIGYGKMGKDVERVAIARGHAIASIITSSNQAHFIQERLLESDVVIEFTVPDKALYHVQQCLSWGIPIVSGTTGWYQNLPKVEQLCRRVNGTMLATSNFSLGVNMFFCLNAYLAKLMQKQKAYYVRIEESHHMAKKDKPSGTAIRLADQIIDVRKELKRWTLSNDREGSRDEVLPITSIREGGLAGTHHIIYQSLIDDIMITHKAHNREGFALGAVLAAEYIYNKKGIFTMQDVLNIAYKDV